MKSFAAFIVSLLLAAALPCSLAQPGARGGPGGGQMMAGPGMMMGGGSGETCPEGNGVNTNVTEVAGLWQVHVTGCPNYDPSGQTTPNTPTVQDKTFSFPTTPVISTSPIMVSIYLDAAHTVNPSGGVKGPIGVAINGIPIYSDADAEDRDAYIYEGSTFDDCGGHAGPSGEYHYHKVPNQGCIFTDTQGQHSPFWAIMADGIPMAGDLGDNGLPPTDLDNCGGHVDETYPFYHYHSVGDANPYTVRCLRGCVQSDQQGFQMLTNNAATCTPATQQYDFSSMMGYVQWTAGTFEPSGTNSNNTPTPNTNTNATNAPAPNTNTNTNTNAPGSNQQQQQQQQQQGATQQGGPQQQGGRLPQQQQAGPRQGGPQLGGQLPQQGGRPQRGGPGGPGGRRLLRA